MSMPNSFEEAFDGIKDVLCKKIRTDGELLVVLEDKKIITDIQREALESENTEHERCKRLLGMLVRGGAVLRESDVADSRVGDFFEALKRTNQLHVIDFIQQSFSERRSAVDSAADLQNILQTKGPAEYLEALGDPARKVAYPEHWKSREANFSQRKMVSLVSSDDGYGEVARLVMETWEEEYVGIGADAEGLKHKSIEIKQIWRVENQLLYDRYQMKKKEICRAAAAAESDAHPFPLIEKLDRDEVKTRELKLTLLESDLVPMINEYVLLHGTEARTRDNITKQGFDPRLASSAYFGRGVYFAESSTKSDQYADDMKDRNQNGTLLYMFVARVLLGNPFRALEPKAYKRAPCTETGCNKDVCKHSTLHDSVVGVKGNRGKRLLFREFIVYDRDQTYPEYLVEYIRK